MIAHLKTALSRATWKKIINRPEEYCKHWQDFLCSSSPQNFIVNSPWQKMGFILPHPKIDGMWVCRIRSYKNEWTSSIIRGCHISLLTGSEKGRDTGDSYIFMQKSRRIHTGLSQRADHVTPLWKMKGLHDPRKNLALPNVVRWTWKKACFRKGTWTRGWSRSIITLRPWLDEFPTGPSLTCPGIHGNGKQEANREGRKVRGAWVRGSAVPQKKTAPTWQRFFGSLREGLNVQIE